MSLSPESSTPSPAERAESSEADVLDVVAGALVAGAFFAADFFVAAMPSRPPRGVIERRDSIVDATR